MVQSRETVLQELANRIAAVQSDHTLRVAIDGVDTSGKTSLANELITPLEVLGRPVIRASVDGFHRPRQERYARGKDSPEGYYYDSFNNTALAEKLLIPLGFSATSDYHDAIFDYRTDTALETPAKQAPKGAVLLFDGVFLLRPELNPYWDLRIFVKIPFEEMIKRAVIRDNDILGDEVEAKYKARYIPGQQLYLESVRPEELADIVVENTNLKSPLIIAKQKSTIENR